MGKTLGAIANQLNIVYASKKATPIIHKYKTMVQAESAEVLHVTFSKIQKIDNKNLSWFVRYLKTYTVIYRKYVKGLRSLMLKMRRAPMLTETAAASENNIYRSILDTVNIAEEHTRLAETEFSLVKDAVEAYLKTLNQLEKTYNVILSDQKLRASGENPKKKRQIPEQKEIDESKSKWKRDVYNAFKTRTKIYTKIKTLKLDFDFNKDKTPKPEPDKQPPGQPSAEEHKTPSEAPSCVDSLVLPCATKDSSNIISGLCTAAYFEPICSVSEKNPF